MKNKKYLAWLIAANNLRGVFTSHSFLIEKLCEKFEKIYLINLLNLRYFPDYVIKKKEFNDKIDKKFKIPKNFEIFYPKTKKEFEDFMIGKELIAINNLGKLFSDLSIHLFLNKHRIKLIQISQIGNIQITQNPVKGHFWKGIKYKLRKLYSQKLTVLLSNLRLVPKMEIRFITNLDIIRNINKSFIKKILFKLKLFYAKELVIINSRTSDIIRKDKNDVSEDHIVLLDFQIDHIENVYLREKIDKHAADKHYYHLKKLMSNLSNMYNKKVVVCIHPQDNLESKKNIFPDFEVVQFRTRECIFKAFLVLFFDSSAIIDAIFLNKRIITLISNYLDYNSDNGSLLYQKKIGIFLMNIQDEIKSNKDELISILDKAKENYSGYIESNIAPDGDRLGYEIIIKTLKERFFN